MAAEDELRTEAERRLKWQLRQAGIYLDLAISALNRADEITAGRPELNGAYPDRTYPLEVKVATLRKRLNRM